VSEKEGEGRAERGAERRERIVFRAEGRQGKGGERDGEAF